ncbi:Hypothetical predicted protein [Pelobates cultripes]|uniref:Uncharacterized protein n=1 Tax=Pelobates cultripes TaxID=61616 RepID=A0AAD1T2H7_PELCU|nr:Hypothetical predicted protein [Pelobates cultripes]
MLILPSLVTAPVPGWGIALLVLVSIILACLLLSMCCLPFLCCRSSSGDNNQNDQTFYMPHFRLSKRSAQN